ncbi:glycosyltransferase [Bacteroidota bacterium]
MKPEVSYIISFYNSVHSLQLILQALKQQTFTHFEVLIADDGSKPEVVKDIEKIKPQFTFPILHVWHEDRGWRKNTILNRSILESTTEYLIFTDGDCIPHPQFIKEHLIHRCKGTVLTGRRVHLSEFVTKRLNTKKIEKKSLQSSFFLLSVLLRLFKKGAHVENGIYVKSKFIRRKLNKKDRGVLGSNFSIFKVDILGVNGFDERYTAPAVGEDTDLEFRLRLNGMKVKTLKHLAIQYHLYHEKLERKSQNKIIFEQTKRDRISYTPYGIKKT